MENLKRSERQEGPKWGSKARNLEPVHTLEKQFMSFFGKLEASMQGMLDNEYQGASHFFPKVIFEVKVWKGRLFGKLEKEKTGDFDKAIFKGNHKNTDYLGLNF